MNKWHRSISQIICLKLKKKKIICLKLKKMVERTHLLVDQTCFFYCSSVLHNFHMKERREACVKNFYSSINGFLFSINHNFYNIYMTFTIFIWRLQWSERDRKTEWESIWKNEQNIQKWLEYFNAIIKNAGD